MDLSSLNPGAGGAPDHFDSLSVETRVALDEHGRPVYIVVPAPVRAPAPGSAPDGTPHYAPVPITPPQGAMVPLQQAPPYSWGPSAPPAPYSPLRDPWVVRLAVGGAAVVGAGFALSAVLAALAAAETALGFLLGALALIWLLSNGSKGGRGSGVNVQITNTNSSRRRR